MNPLGAMGLQSSSNCMVPSCSGRCSRYCIQQAGKLNVTPYTRCVHREGHLAPWFRHKNHRHCPRAPTGPLFNLQAAPGASLT
eukprot:scaffold169145_cov18-Tisochrysis_lutea.AAC.1